MSSRPLIFTLHCDAPNGRSERFALCPLHGDLILLRLYPSHLTASGRRDLASELIMAGDWEQQ